MLITVNGDARSFPDPTTVADVLPATTSGVAVALNGTVVPRHRHAATPLAEGDAVEIVTAVQGG